MNKNMMWLVFAGLAYMWWTKWRVVGPSGITAGEAQNYDLPTGPGSGY
jgi:hypothetical protein